MEVTARIPKAVKTIPLSSNPSTASGITVKRGARLANTETILLMKKAPMIVIP
jgi:hypothetical protein